MRQSKGQKRCVKGWRRLGLVTNVHKATEVFIVRISDKRVLESIHYKVDFRNLLECTNIGTLLLASVLSSDAKASRYANICAFYVSNVNLIIN